LTGLEPEVEASAAAVEPLGGRWGTERTPYPGDDEPMSEAKAKDRVIDAVRDLPDDATIEDAMERLYFLAKVEKGFREADAGQTVGHEEAKRRILE
jgi:hypothetical protein